MKKNLVLMMVLFAITFASIANAAPKKKSSKKPVRPAAAVAKAAPASVSPTTNVSIDEARKNLGELVPSAAEILQVPAKKYDINDPMQAFESQTSAPEYVTTTGRNGKKSVVRKNTGKSYNFNMKFNPLGIFMPDKLSLTAKRDWVQLSYGARFPNGVDTSGQPAGFQTSVSDQNTLIQELTLEGKYGWFGVEGSLLPYTRTVGYKFNASSLGKYEVTTLSELVAKLYWHDDQSWSSSVGLGYEYNVISGAIKMGGFPFKTTGDGGIPVLKLEGTKHLNKVWSATLGIKFGGPKLDTEIPGATNLITSMPYNGYVKLRANIVELLAIPLGK